MTASTRLVHSPDVISQEVSGEMVLLDLESEQYFGLDPVGSRIWQLIGERGSPDAVLAALLEEYEVGEEQLRRDLKRILGELVAAGLLRPAA